MAADSKTQRTIATNAVQMLNKERYRLKRHPGKDVDSAEHENSVMLGLYSDGANMTRIVLKGTSQRIQ